MYNRDWKKVERYIENQVLSFSVQYIYTYIYRPLVIPKKIELIPIPIPATVFGFNSNSNSQILVRINSNSNSNSGQIQFTDRR